MALNLTRFQPFKLLLLSHHGQLCCCQALFQRFLFFTESSCSIAVSYVASAVMDSGWLIRCALNTLLWHHSTICSAFMKYFHIYFTLKTHRSTALTAPAKHHVFVKDCTPWILSGLVHIGSCCQSAAVFMGRTVALLSSMHGVSTELFLFPLLFPHLLLIVSFVCYVCSQVGFHVLDEFRGSLKSIHQ